MKNIYFLLFLTSILASCNSERKADLIITNANIYTVSDGFSDYDAIVVNDGKINTMISSSEAAKYTGPETKTVDAENNFLMPGFIEGHGHFSGLGYSLIYLNFLDSKSWAEIVAMVEEKIKTAEPGEWIVGRGWHQEKWDSTPINNVHGYPYHDDLSAISPDNPVVLRHASGHGLFANKKAMDVSGVTKETPNAVGGEIVRDNNGEAIGMFEERSMSAIMNKYREFQSTLSQEELTALWYTAIEKAEEECLRKGVTSFQDAGSSFTELERYEGLAEKGELDVRLWAMARHGSETLKGKVGNYRKIGVGGDFFTCRAIKSEVDGALGSFGAWLLEPYNDKPDFVGQNTTEIEEVKKIADIAIANDMQLCVHAIGDRANKEVVDLFEERIKTKPEGTDLRWRMEHAQHLDTADIPRFAELDIIASMQGIHCTSDAPFVEKRLGYDRAKYGAYPWRSLLDAGVVIANGTDAPVEDVDPIESYYASVTRKRVDNGFEFFPEQSMTREEAVYSYTLGNAFAGFEEDIKGSVDVGKYADFVILSKDLLNCTDAEILEAKVLYSIVNGEVKYQGE